MYLNKCISDQKNSISSYSVRTSLRIGDVLFSEMESLSQTQNSCRLPDPCGFHTLGFTNGLCRHNCRLLCPVFAESSSSLHIQIFLLSQLNSRILIHCLRSLTSALGPYLTTSSLDLLCSRHSRHVLISPNSL